MKNKEKGSFLYRVAIARKVNAVISLVCTFLILVHGGYDALWMFMRGKLPNLPKGAIAQAWSVAEIFRIILD